MSDPYDVHINGGKADPYRILLAYGITHPAHQHAVKKLLRAGRSHKLLIQDIEEAIQSLERWKEMIAEDLGELAAKQKVEGPLAVVYFETQELGGPPKTEFMSIRTPRDVRGYMLSKVEWIRKPSDDERITILRAIPDNIQEKERNLWEL